VSIHGYYGGIRLVKATIKKFVEYCQGRHTLHDRNFSIRYESNIPRQVGLAGSSAIIVATLRALMDFYGVDIPLHVQPSFVLGIESDELGIVAGLQDRVIQVYGGLVYMDFARDRMQLEDGYPCGVYQPLDPSLLPPLYIAYSADVGEPTEVLHNRLRARYDHGDIDVVRAMDTFADLALRAKSALEDGDADLLSRLIDENFDTRRSICQLHQDHVRMVELARSVGASAKYAGSGGAIIGTYRDDAMYQALKVKMEALNCCVFRPRVA
jgi:glucuronokinase